eukprot:4780467-Prymnesium_polylepis.1
MQNYTPRTRLEGIGFAHACLHGTAHGQQRARRAWARLTCHPYDTEDCPAVPALSTVGLVAPGENHADRAL